MKKKKVLFILMATIILGFFPQVEYAAGINVSQGAISVKSQLPEGFPAFIPLVEDATLVSYVKRSEDRTLDLILKTNQSEQELWDFYSNVNLYKISFDRCIASFDNKTGKISIELLKQGFRKLGISIAKDTDEKMYIACSITAPPGNESLLGDLKDMDQDLETKYNFYDLFIRLVAGETPVFQIDSRRTKPNRDAFKGKIATGFPPDIPLLKNRDNVIVSKAFKLDNITYTDYNYHLKITEPECLKFYMNYRNFSNLDHFQIDYQNQSGNKNVKVIARSKSGICTGIRYYYENTRGTVIINHNSAENELLI